MKLCHKCGFLVSQESDHECSNNKGYVIEKGIGKYVKSYDFETKETTETDRKAEAIIFSSRVEVDYFARKFGGIVARV
jgi:hypothetical protein